MTWFSMYDSFQTLVQYTCERGRFIPRPRPAFCHLQYRKVVRAWYLSSREHDVIGKWQKSAELTSYILPDYTLNAWCVRQSPPLPRYKLPGTFADQGPVCPHTLKPFLPSFLSWRQSHGKRYQALTCSTVKQERAWYLFPCDWRQDRKDGRKGTHALPYWKWGKPGQGFGTRVWERRVWWT